MFRLHRRMHVRMDRKYMSAIMKLDTLSREEERDLVIRYKVNGDTKARDRLVNHFMKLVISRAKLAVKRFPRKSYESDLEEMISDGTYGLMRAINKFDPNHISPKTGVPVRLSSYAESWIDVCMIAEARDRRSLVYNLNNGKLKGIYTGLPRKIADKGWESPITFPQAVVLASEFGKTVTADEVLAMDRLRAASEYELDAPAFVGDDGSKGSRMDLLVDGCDVESDANRSLELDRMREHLVEVIAKNCDEREKVILLEHTFSRDPDKPRIEQIAKRLGITRNKANAIEVAAEARICELMKDLYARMEAQATTNATRPRRGSALVRRVRHVG